MFDEKYETSPPVDSYLFFFNQRVCRNSMDHDHRQRAKREKTPSESIQITGYRYSINTGLEQESLEDVSLAELKKGLSKIEHAGSLMIVSIYSIDILPSSELTEIMKELHKNLYFELLYLENGYGLRDGRVHEGLKQKTKRAN